ncbi:MAG TPA: SurA N-terminal domain-containing protein [Candidatus Thermoplasmatota archaeon]|nr:SurA N-terminal domain-containing protein [Candidatus Thermoplasmatota archaeon]
MNPPEKILTIIILVFIISLFLLPGCTDQSQNNTNKTDTSDSDMTGTIAATVNGEEITTDEVTLFVQQQQGQISESYALERLIEQKILTQQARLEGYTPTDQEAEDYLKDLLTQRNQTLDEYKQYLEQQELSYEERLQSYKDQLALQNYLDDAIKAEKYDLSDEEAEQDLEELLTEQNRTLDEYKEYLGQEGYSYEEQLQNYKVGLQRQALIEDLREDAVVEYSR